MRKVLALSIGAVLVVAFIFPSLSIDSVAQSVSSESRILLAILGLTEVIKSQTEDLGDTTHNIWHDLEFKKKFYEFDRLFKNSDVNGISIFEDDCSVDDDACAFNVESIQIHCINDPVQIDRLNADVVTEFSGKNITTPTNLLVDAGIGKVGASQSVQVVFDGLCFDPEIVVSGEKPQGMKLGLSVIG